MKRAERQIIDLDREELESLIKEALASKGYRNFSSVIFPVQEAYGIQGVMVNATIDVEVPPSKEELFIEKAMEMRNCLFNIANAFSGDETGHIAIILHEACNLIMRAKKELTV